MNPLNATSTQAASAENAGKAEILPRLDQLSDLEWTRLGKILAVTDRKLWPIKCEERLTPDRCFANAIHLNPKNAEAFYELGKFLNLNPKVCNPLLLSKPFDLLAQANFLEPTNETYLLGLGNAIDCWSKATVNGKKISRQTCYLDAIRHNSSCYEAFFNLGTTIPKGNEVAVTLQDGSEKRMNAKDCFIKALELGPPPFFSEGFFALAGVLLPDEIAMLKCRNGKCKKDDHKLPFSKQQCLIRSVDINPNFAKAFLELAETIPDEGFVTVRNLGKLTKSACLLRTIRLDSSWADAFYDLARPLLPGESITVTFQDGSKKQLDAKGCCLEAIRLAPNFSTAFWGLGVTLLPDEEISVKFEDGTDKKLNKQACFIRALELHPDYPHALCDLGLTFSPNQLLINVNGESLSRSDCFRRAIQLNPQLGLPWHLFGSTFPVLPRNSSQLSPIDGTPITKRECHLKALELGPVEGDMFFELGTTLEDNALVNVRFPDGSELPFNNEACYVQAIALNPQNAHAFFRLSWILRKAGGVIKLADGQVFTAEQCMERAVSLNPKLSSSSSLPSPAKRSKIDPTQPSN